MTIAKAIVAALVALGASLVVALDDDTVTSQEWLTAVLAILGSAGVVWYVSNGPGSQYAKAIVGSLTAGITTLLVALEDNIITHQEWVKTFVAAIVGLGIVAIVPNAAARQHRT
jgi:GT2 family glycosyltransferase